MAKKGERMPEETKRKISEAQKGKPRKPRGPEGNKKHSESMKKVWASGGMYPTHSDETKVKISEHRKGKCLGNAHGFKEGFTPWNKGKSHNVHTPEWRARVSAANSGPNHWNWKGGVSSENRLLRNSTKRKEWTMAVFRRDHWTCRQCGFHGQKIDMIAHHLIPWSKSKELRFEVSNGVTLCRGCHCALHKPRTGTGKSPKPQSV